VGVKATSASSVLKKAQKLLEKSGMTLDELGVKMGYESGTARRAVWQLFHKTPDPRLSTLTRLADALGVELRDLL
jgi:transcriptional regulator with XRE-family HTH domain